MSKYEEHFKAFLRVREALNTNETRAAYALCYHKPFKFYGEHPFEEAIEILKAESADRGKKYEAEHKEDINVTE